MSKDSANPMEEVCDTLEADSVGANFTGSWCGWGLVDIASIKPTGEWIYTMLDREGLAFKPLIAESQFYNPITGLLEKAPEEYHILRGDNGTWIGRGRKSLVDSMSLGGHYETLQLLVGELSQTALPCRAISFRNGARALIQMLIPEEHIILGRPHKAFYSVYNALDGSSGAKIGFSDYCPVCQNTYAALRAEIADNGFKARHTTSMEAKLKSIREKILDVGEAVKEYYGTLEKLAVIPADNDLIRQFVQAVVQDGPATEKRGKVSEATIKHRSEVATAIQVSNMERNGTGYDVTFYDLLQGVTRVTSRKDAYYSLFGNGAMYNERAMAWLTKASE